MPWDRLFFSLSLAGNGTVVYGSYLSDKEDAPSCAKYTAIFDTLAAFLAALVILPSVFAFNLEPGAGPPLMFITMPLVFKSMYGGQIFAIIFFVAVLFAGISSLINLYETPVELLEEKLHLNRWLAVAATLTPALIIGLFIEEGNKLGGWMDAVSIYVIPLGALLAAIVFFWVCEKDFVLNEVNKGAKLRLGNGYYFMGRYIYCGITLIVYLLGVFFGGIG